MKTCPASLITGEMQIRITRHQPLHTFQNKTKQTKKKKKKERKKCVGKDVKKLEPLCIAMEM